jgi:hypothetical protein
MCGLGAVEIGRRAIHFLVRALHRCLVVLERVL